MLKSKKIIALLVSILLIISSMSFTAFATTTTAGYVDEPLIFTSTEDASAAGYEWVASTKTLTITYVGLTIEVDTNYKCGITLPADSTIIINGELNIDTFYRCIYCNKGDLKIVVNADTNIISNGGYEAIVVVDGNLTLDVSENITMNVSGYNAFCAYSAVKDTNMDINVDGVLNLNASNTGSVGIRNDDSVTFTGTGDIYVYGISTPIYAGESTSALSNVYLGTSASDTFTITFGNIVSSTYSSSYTIADNVEVNGLISYTDKEIIYGEYTATSSLSISGNTRNSLYFSKGSLVTINENVYIDLTSYASVDYTYATIINNGTLVLSSDAPDISDLSITGDGVIVVIGDDGLYYCYDNYGEFLYVEGEAILSNTEITNSALFSWTKDADDVYTLELFSGVDYEDISFCIEVDSAIINLTSDVKVDEIYFDEMNSGTNLTIMGDFTLTCDCIEGEGNLTISDGTTLDTEEIYMNSYSNNSILSNLIVSGTLKVTDEMYIGNLEVTNTGYLYLDGDFQSYSRNGTAPTVSLGDQIKIISPEDVYYSVEGDSRYYGYFYTSDGDEVTALIIGLKPSYDITVTTTDDGEVTTEDESFTVMEGFDKEFTITAYDGYEISEVIVDGVSIGVVSSYTFENVTEEHTLEVEFVLIVVSDEEASTGYDDTATGDGATDDETDEPSTDDGGTDENLADDTTGDATTDDTTSDDDTTTDDEDDDSDVVQTGDTNIVPLMVVLMFTSLLGVVYISRKKLVK